MKIITTVVIASDDQNIGRVIDWLFGRGAIIDMGRTKKLNERGTKSVRKLHRWIIQAGRFIIDCPTGLPVVLNSHEDINFAVLLIEEYNRSGVVVGSGGDSTTAP